MEFFDTGDVRIAFDQFGDGPPVVLLHGFPQTRALWSDVAESLARDYRVYTPDLRGYGHSDAPQAAPDLSNYTFRAMARDIHALMSARGHARYHLVGHDRGGRVAYRLARDVPGAVATLTVMDIVPTDHLVETCDFALAKAYFHWTFLAQPAPMPERMIGADPDAFFEACLLGWGGASLPDFKQLDAYRDAWRRPEIIAGMTNDYRAAVGPDLHHDAEDEGRVDVPALVLFGADGVMAKSYDVADIWKRRFSDMRVQSIPGGHFFVDLHSDKVAAALSDFLKTSPL